MGANFLTRTYRGNSTKAEITQQVEQDQRQDECEDGCSYSGSWGVKCGINYLNKTFKSIDEADEWIADNNDKWGAIDIVKFDNEAGTKAQKTRLEKLEQKDWDLKSDRNKLRAELKDIDGNALTKLKSIKSKTKSCKHCGERYIVKNLTSINCKCGEYLVSATEITRISKNKAKLREKIAKVTEKINKNEVVINELTAKMNREQGYVAGGWCSS